MMDWIIIRKLKDLTTISMNRGQRLTVQSLIPRAKEWELKNLFNFPPLRYGS